MNFSVILFVLVLFTGFFYMLDLLVFKPKRRFAAQQALASAGQSAQLDPATERKLRHQLMKQPIWLEYSASFFPVILFVFLLRSFVVEPFKIPSGSMIPTLLIGDLILVNKFTYGIRLPIIDKKIVPLSDPKRGDVVVFRYPMDPSLDYIKRVVGIGGDVIEYKNKKLTINGVPQAQTAMDKFYDPNTFSYSLQFKENLAGKEHRILNDEEAPVYVVGAQNFPNRENCQYDVNGFRCVVPKGQYFMMGDNRDNSSDSRIWGFVQDKQIVGKAFLVWMNFNDFSRIGFFR
ncbi:MAG TPA: signal peptidase I [Limnobacter sp.]|uniref:signal peptidase I n=1 Tax=Limnobacter sp. TaxID=2003368 RepID=UPI002EDAE2DA